MSLRGLEEYDLRGSSPAGGLVTTLGRQILKSNGLASPYSQLKWKFSIKTTQLKTLKIFEPNSQAKMAPDNRLIEKDGITLTASPMAKSGHTLTKRVNYAGGFVAEHGRKSRYGFDTAVEAPHEADRLYLDADFVSARIGSFGLDIVKDLGPPALANVMVRDMALILMNGRRLAHPL
jgi:hypothetical protein